MKINETKGAHMMRHLAQVHGGSTADENGQTVTRGWMVHSDRSRFDHVLCRRGDGWEQYDTPQDASYYGVWVHPPERLIATYTERDWTLTECASSAVFWVALEDLARFHRRAGVTR